MDFLRRLFRSEQHDASSASNNQPASDIAMAVAEPDQHAASDNAATDAPPTEAATGSAEGEPHPPTEDASSERQWWEESSPPTEHSSTVVTTSAASAEAAAPDAEQPAADEERSSETAAAPDAEQPAADEERSSETAAAPDAEQPTANEELTPSKAPTEPLSISRTNTPEQESAGVAEPSEPASPDALADAAAPVATPEAEGDTEPDAPEAETEQATSTVDMEEEGTHRLSFQRAPSLSSQHSAQGLAAAALRDVGRIRQNNQDSVFATLTTLPREGADLPMGLFVVADGMGGHDSGELASRLAVRSVAQEVISQLIMPALDDAMTEALQPLMVAAVQEANRAIWDHAQTIHSDMGTTCTAVLLMGQALYIAHVGDSRAYLLEAGGLRCLTDDHSAVGRLIQLGQLEPSAARDHPLRSQLYRTVGQQPQVQVDFIYQQFSGSSHLLLCSDGLWGMISEEDIQQALTNHLWPHDACRELIALANLAGGEDNISAIVVTLPIAERSSQ
jgi:serine/threonine protein phosphatase PrpC